MIAGRGAGIRRRSRRIDGSLRRYSTSPKRGIGQNVPREHVVQDRGLRSGLSHDAGARAVDRREDWSSDPA
jgi:hypothetical protein